MDVETRTVDVPTLSPAEALARADLVAAIGRHHAVGAVLGVSRAGVRDVATAGSVSHGGPAVERGTRFLIASVTKSLVATTIAAAVEAGLLCADTCVVDVLPSFGHREVTVDQLLTHTSGLPDLWPEADDEVGALSRFVDGLAAVDLHARPGTRFGYSNAGYATLGRLLEVVYGAPCETVLERRLLAPLGSRATFRPDDVPERLLARGHTFDVANGTNTVVADRQGPRSFAAAGSRLYATVDDLLSFGELHLSASRGVPARRPLPGPAALGTMAQRALEIPDPRHGRWVARGLLVDDAWGTPLLMHDGGALGHAAYVRIVPEDDTVIALMATGGVP